MIKGEIVQISKEIKMNKIRKKIRRFNHWFWDEGQEWLVILVIAGTLIAWIVYIIIKE